ncbi:MAG: hypothetical protein ACQESP_12635 [Candidatus Muiribacteriota bacterium]
MSDFPNLLGLDKKHASSLSKSYNIHFVLSTYIKLPVLNFSKKDVLSAIFFMIFFPFIKRGSFFVFNLISDLM